MEDLQQVLKESFQRSYNKLQNSRQILEKMSPDNSIKLQLDYANRNLDFLKQSRWLLTANLNTGDQLVVGILKQYYFSSLLYYFNCLLKSSLTQDTDLNLNRQKLNNFNQLVVDNGILALSDTTVRCLNYLYHPVLKQMPKVDWSSVQPNQEIACPINSKLTFICLLNSTDSNLSELTVKMTGNYSPNEDQLNNNLVEVSELTTVNFWRQTGYDLFSTLLLKIVNDSL